MFRTIISPKPVAVDGAYRISSPRGLTAAQACALLTGEESKYPPACCADCASPAKPGCAGRCAVCWARLRAGSLY